MSKKDRKYRKPKPIAPVRVVEEKPAPAPKKTLQGGRSHPLILFSMPTKIFVFAILALYFILSFAKIHTSNIANWDMFFGLEKSEAVISGKPRFIRMDEWMVSSPAAIGQYNAGMPLSNASIGDLNAPVIWGLPVKDVGTILRPNLWPYFVFDVERAFAFAWNFNICVFLISTFLLLMLLTRNKFWLSVTGTFFIFLSGGLQWWSYFIGNYMLYLNGMFISFAYILYNKKLVPLIVSGLVFILSVYGFIFNLYPPFQVPLVYLFIFLFIGFLLQRKNFQVIRENWQLKTIIFSAALVILAFFIVHYYGLVKDTYSMMLNTVYPGRRFSTGGDLGNAKLFAEFFGIFMDDLHVPREWLNICEASSFMMFFPIVFYCVGYYFFKTRKTDPLVLAVAAYVVVGLLYLLVGFPAFLSKLTLFSMTPAHRAFPIIAAGNCMLLFCYLGSDKFEIKNEKLSWIEFGIIAVVTFIFMRVVGTQINNVTKNFFTASQVNIASALVVIAYLLVRYKYLRYATPALYVLLIGLTIPNLKVNPVTKGLSPIFDNPLVIDSKEIHEKDPTARWALFGNMRLTHLLKANGIDVFNCVKLVPPMKDMKVLDPTGKNDSVYNRYAWITMTMYVDGRDTVIFRKQWEDGYTIFLDPCSPKLKQLGVKYFVFDHKPEPAEARCMTKLKENAGLSIYKRND